MGPTGSVSSLAAAATIPDPAYPSTASYGGNIQYLLNISEIDAICCLLLVKLRSDHRLILGPSALHAAYHARIALHCGVIYSMDNLHRALVNEQSGSESGHPHRSSGTGTTVLFATAQIVGILSCVSNVKLDSKGWAGYYFFLSAIYYALQSMFGDGAYLVRMCKYASNAALGVAISPLVTVGWARLFGLPVVI